MSPSCANQHWAVHCALGLHSVTQLRYPVHCKFCDLCKCIVHQEFSLLLDCSRKVICSDHKKNIAPVQKLEQVVYSVFPLRVVVYHRTMPHCFVHLAWIRSRNWVAQFHALFTNYVSAQCISFTLQGTSGVLTGHVPTSHSAYYQFVILVSDCRDTLHVTLQSHSSAVRVKPMQYYIWRHMWCRIIVHSKEHLAPAI